MSRIAFGLSDAALAEAVSPTKAWLQSIRAISLTATLTPCLATYLYARLLGLAPNVPIALASIAGALLLQISVNLWNDVEDHARLIDVPGSLGGAGVIQKGWISAERIKHVAVASLILGLALGLPALIAHPRPLFAIGILAAIGTAGYSGKPFGFKYRALGDLTVLLLCGPGLTVGFSIATFGQAPPGILALGLFFGLAAVGILHANNIQDVEVDRSRGALTVASLMSGRTGRIYFALLYVAAFIAWIVASTFPTLSVVAKAAPFLALAIAVPMLLSVAREADLSAPKFKLLRVTAAQLHLVLGLLVCAALGVTLAVR